MQLKQLNTRFDFEDYNWLPQHLAVRGTSLVKQANLIMPLLEVSSAAKFYYVDLKKFLNELSFKYRDLVPKNKSQEFV